MLVEGGGDSLFAATGFRSARALATMIYAAPDAAAHTEYLQTEMANLPIFRWCHSCARAANCPYVGR